MSRFSGASTPVDRIALIRARLKAAKDGRRKNGACRENLSAAREVKCRARRESLWAEQDYWTGLVQESHGSVQQAVKLAGVDRETVEKAWWDLGLWPDVVRARAAAKQARQEAMTS